MAIVIPDLSTLDETLVNEAFDVIAERIAEFDPTVQTKFGAFHNLVVYVDSVITAALQTNLTEATDSISLYKVSTDPELSVDDEIVDSVAANFRISRRTGVKATGSITVVVTEERQMLVPAGTVFTSSGLNYLADQTYSIRISEDQVQTDNDRQLVSVGDDKWAFVIGVIAESAGISWNLEADTRLTLTSDIDLSEDIIYVESSISGGVDEETSTELASRVLSGISTKAWSNRTNIEALIKAEDDFADVTNVSIIGFGDQEMLRDQHSLWPGSMGGRVDLYIRTQPQLGTITLTKAATLINKTGSLGRFTFSIEKDEVPGFYEITKIVPEANSQISGFLPDTDVRDINVNDSDVYTPDIDTATEGAFSAYQTTTIEFEDTVTNVSALTEDVDTIDYLVTISYMPNIKEIQDFLGDRSVRSPAGDLLVKAPVPCFVSIGMTISKSSNEDAPDTDLIAQSIADEINSTGFVGKVSTAKLASIAYPFLTSTMAITSISITGRLLRPDLTVLNITDDKLLSIPDEASSMVSYRTVQFYSNPIDMVIDVVSSGT